MEQKEFDAYSLKLSGRVEFRWLIAAQIVIQNIFFNFSPFSCFRHKPYPQAKKLLGVFTVSEIARSYSGSERGASDLYQFWAGIHGDIERLIAAPARLG